MLWKVLRFDWANEVLAARSTLRGRDTLIDFLWFLFLNSGRGKMICPLMEEHFFDLSWTVKFFIAAK